MSDLLEAKEVERGRFECANCKAHNRVPTYDGLTKLQWADYDRQDFIDRAAIAVLPEACAPDNNGQYMTNDRRVAMALDLAEALWAERERRRKES